MWNLQRRETRGKAWNSCQGLKLLAGFCSSDPQDAINFNIKRIYNQITASGHRLVTHVMATLHNQLLSFLKQQSIGIACCPQSAQGPWPDGQRSCSSHPIFSNRLQQATEYSKQHNIQNSTNTETEKQTKISLVRPSREPRVM
jgi:hypothetical protein